jgi:hypothetical protein
MDERVDAMASEVRAPTKGAAWRPAGDTWTRSEGHDLPTWPAWREVLALGSLVGLAQFVMLHLHARYSGSTLLGHGVLSASSGMVAAWVVLSVRHPPLPPTALVAVRPLHRAFFAAAIRTCVAAAVVSLLLGARDPSSLNSPLDLLLYGSFMSAPVVALGAFTEELLLGRRDWQAAAAGLLASGAAFYVFVTQAQWIFAGAPSAAVGIDLGRTAAKVLPLAFPVAVVAAVRMRGAGILAVTVALALLTPLLALVWVLVDDRWLSRIEFVASLVVALPIAVRAGDLVGPGRIVSD